MEDDCLEKKPRPFVPPRQTSHPSFSATLLDAIYRSLDDGTPEIERVGTKNSKQRPQFDAPSQKKKTHSDHFWWTSTKRKQAPPSYTSSDTSSYGFSSDAELPHSRPIRVTRVQFTPPTLPPRTPPQEKKKKSNPFRMRWMELRKGRTSTNSNSIGASTRGGSGSPLSNFLKAIFSSRTRKKNKNIMDISAPQQGGVAIPVLAPVPPPEETDDIDDIDIEAEAVKRRIEEILRGLEKDKEEGEGEDDDDDDDGSDGSSDLFELENLTEIVTDELPVYCTTSLVANHPPLCCK